MQKSTIKTSIKYVIFTFVLTVLSLTTPNTALAQKDLVISGGNAVSSFVCANRRVYVWGNNESNGSFGLLGTGDMVSSFLDVPTQVNIPGGIDIQQVNSGSGSHFVALDCNNSVWSWGNNSFGQVGNGAIAGCAGAPVTTPSPVSAGVMAGTAWDAGGQLTGVDVVYAGNNNSFAILDDGRLVSWGGNTNGCSPPYDNANGQLGDGTGTFGNQTAPVFVVDGTGSPLTGVVQVFAGDNVAYALVDTDGDGIGTVYSWGNGLNGTLGRNAAGTGNPNNATAVVDDRARPVYYGDQTIMDNITAISSGDVFGMALDVDGYVWTWGNGGWNSATGHADQMSDSEPGRVVAGSTIGASNDGTYLLASSIGGGQGYGMAVTIDGKPVSWGGNSCADGGLRGDGTTGAPAFGAGPNYITYGGGLVHDNVTLINRGDHWGFYGTADNEFYAWGCNQFGQLGIGGTTDQLEATQITPPGGCDFRDPAPFENLTPGNTQVCSNTWGGTLLNSGFTAPPGIGASYEIRWYEDGILQVTGNANTDLTFMATNVATYRVEIEYIGSNAGCQVYDIATDEMTFIEPAAPFSDPGTNEYCGTSITTANVTGTGSFEWYAAAAGGSSLASSTNGGNIDAAIPLASLTQLSPTQYEVWVEDVSSFSTTVGPVSDLSGWGRDGAGAVSNNSWLEFTVTQALTIDFVDVYAYNSWNGSFPITVELQDNTGAMIQSVTTAPLTGTANTTQHTVALGLNVPGPGTYRLAYVAGAGQLHYDGNSHPVGNWPYTDAAGVISITNNYDQGNITPNNYSYFYNWQVTTGTLYPCGRLQVLLNENCPPCAPPTSLSIDQADPTDLCVGDNQTLSGTYALATPTDQYYYTWLKDGIAVAPASTTYADLTLTGVTVADDANYTLRIEDGNNSNSVCYLEDDMDLNVHVVPDITVTDPAAVCSPATVDITGTWVDNNTSGGTVTYHSATPASGANQIVNQATISTSGTYYILIDNNGCTDEAAVDVTVNTTPDLAITDPASECAPNTVDITGSWVDNNGTTPTVTYHSATPANGGNAISNQAAIPTSGTYYILADNASCTDEAPVTVTIDPATAITTNPTDQTVCDGDNASFTVVATGSGTLSYQWYLGATPVGTDNATLSLTGVTSTDAGSYTVEVTGACGTVTSSAAILTVNPPTTISVHPADVGVCAGSNASFSVTAAGTGTLSYQWFRDATPVGTDNSTLSLTGVTAGDAGNYTVEVTGSCGTVTSNVAVFTITSTEFPAVSLSQPADICEGNTVTFTATVLSGGGAAPEFTFYDASGPTVVQLQSTTATYTTPALTANMDVYVEMTSNSTCIDPGATNPATSSTITVNVDALPSTANIIETDFNTCSNATSLTNDPVTSGTAVWSSTGGSVSATSGTTADVNSLPVGATTVTLTVNSALGLCPSSTDNVDITVLSNLTAPDAGSNDTICETDADPLLVGNTPAGGETGTWFAVGPAGITTGGQTSALQLGENKFYYTMDNGSCSDSDTVSVFVDETPGNIGFTNTPIVTCDVTVALTAQVPSPGTGTWSNIVGPGSPTISAANLNNPTGTITNLDDGITTVDWTVTNGKCSAAPITLTIDKQGSTTSSIITLDGSGFSNQDVTFTSQDLCISNAYTINGSSPNAGAGETATWSIISGTSVSITPNSTETQALTLSGTGATILQWSISSTVPGCSANNGTVTLNVDDAPSAITPLIDFDVCGTSGSMTPSGVTAPASGTGTWTVVSGVISNDFPSTTPGQTFTGLSGSVDMRWTVSTGGACPDETDDVTITQTVPLDPQVTLTASDDPACFGVTNVTFTANATGVTSPTFDFSVGGNLQQSGTSSVFNSSTILDGQVVDVVVTTASTCTNSPNATDQTSISVLFEPSPVIGVGDYDICQGDVTSLTVFTSGGNVQWYSIITGQGPTAGTTSQTNPLNPSQTATYYAIEDNGVCPAVSSDSVTITVNETPTVTLGGPYQLFADETVVLDGSVTPSGSTITWSDPTDLSDPTSTDPVFTGTDANAGIINMTLSADNNGCIGSASTIITVLKPVKIPNAFTPNDDNNNDLWEIEGLETYPNATLEVFNRWGTPVYKSVGTIEWWTGYRGGEAMPVATYYYILDLGIADDESDRYQGSVTLVR